MCVCVFVLASRWEIQFSWYLRKSGLGPYHKNDLVLVTFLDGKKVPDKKEARVTIRWYVQKITDVL